MQLNQSAALSQHHQPPKVVAFDVFQTCFSLEALLPHLLALRLPPDALELWFGRTLRDGFALTAAGAPYQPFQKVAAAALSGILFDKGHENKLDHVPHVMQAFQSLIAEPDVRPALEMLQQKGVRVFMLSNGSRETTETLLEKPGLRGLVERVISIDEVGQWKPAPKVYQYAAACAGVDIGQVALVAAHAWDCQGAKQAGLITGWVRRKEQTYSDALDKPHAMANDLPALCRQLINPTNLHEA